MKDFTGIIWDFIKIRGTSLGGPYIKDYSILGSILGSPYFGKPPYRGIQGLYLGVLLGLYRFRGLGFRGLGFRI